MIFNRFALIEARKRAGLSKSQLADQSGNSRPYITQLENGDRQAPSLAAIRKMADVLGIEDPRALYVQPELDELLREINAARGVA